MVLRADKRADGAVLSRGQRPSHMGGKRAVVVHIMSHREWVVKGGYVVGRAAWGALDKCGTPFDARTTEAAFRFRRRGSRITGRRRIRREGGANKHRGAATGTADEKPGRMEPKSIGTATRCRYRSGCRWDIDARSDEDAIDRKSTRLNSSHSGESRMPSSA